MNALLAPVSCGHCAGSLVFVNGAGGESERVAVVRCAACGREWMVLVQLRPMVSAEGRRRAALRARERVAA